MERTDILELMSRLKLFGMRAAYDEVMANGIKRRHEPPRIVGDLLSAEIAEKQARSIKYQLTIAKLPLAKDLDGFDHRHDQPGIRRVAERLRRRQDDDRAARSADPSLRDHRDRQRQLENQDQKRLANLTKTTT